MRAIFAGLALFLGACSGPAEQADHLANYRVSWTKLPDGSSIGLAGSAGAENRSAMRCWPKAKAGFICALVSEANSAVHMLSVSRREHDALPSIIFFESAPRDGYSCGVLLGAREEISRAGSQLTSNELGRSSPRWPKSHVDKYMKDNAVGGLGYFRCLEILDTVNRGSLDTLGTTSVDKSMVV